MLQQTSNKVIETFFSLQDESQDGNWTPNKAPPSVYNLLSYIPLAMEVERAGISSSVAASICNAHLKCLTGMLSAQVNFNDLVLDKSKIDR